MRDAFHEDLDRISDQLVEMTGMVKTAMNRATDALLNADLAVAESVIAADDDIDALRRQVDDLAVDLLARQQPVATDLRMVVTAMHMASDIERMGDLARHIAKVARLRYPEHAVAPELRGVFEQMEQVAEQLAVDTGNAIASKNVNAALQIERDDDHLDDLHRKVFSILLDDAWNHGTESAVDTTLIARYYERFGDHAVAVAARIVYLVTGAYASDGDGVHNTAETA